MKAGGKVAKPKTLKRGMQQNLYWSGQNYPRHSDAKKLTKKEYPTLIKGQRE